MFKKEKIKDLHYSVSGLLSSEKVSEETDLELKEYGEKAKIPGFRTGHIPVTILRGRYGNEATRDAVNSLINKDLESFVKEKEIRLAAQPKVELTKFKLDEDVEYTIDFDILPKLPKIDFDKITLTKKLHPVKNSDIDSALSNIRKSHSDFEKGDFVAAKDDLVVIDFTGFIGDEKFAGGEAKNHNLTLGSGAFIPGFEDQIIGHKLNDEFDVNVKFPDDYHSKELAGKKARFAVKIGEIRRPILPELNDELAKKVGMESVELLRNHVKEILEKQEIEHAKVDMRNELLDILNEKVKLDLPETLVIQEMESVRKDSKETTNEKKDRKEAERRVKLGLILAEWGGQNEVKVSREELQSAIWTEATRYPNPQEVFDFYNKNQGALSMLNGMLYERKALDAMIDKCKIK